jgi:putative FmdB family regulatory protein
MPTYDYRCDACGRRFADLKSMREDSSHAVCPHCGGRGDKQVTAPLAVRGDAYDWSMENRGKGRRISQLDYDVDKPYYAKSRQAACDEAARRGLYAIKA